MVYIYNDRKASNQKYAISCPSSIFPHFAFSTLHTIDCLLVSSPPQLNRLRGYSIPSHGKKRTLTFVEGASLMECVCGPRVQQSIFVIKAECISWHICSTIEWEGMGRSHHHPTACFYPSDCNEWVRVALARWLSVPSRIKTSEPKYLNFQFCTKSWHVP